MGKEKKRLRIGKHYMMVGSEKVEIDPTKGDLPDRCKVAYAEMLTGDTYELEDDEGMFLEASGS